MSLCQFGIGKYKKNVFLKESFLFAIKKKKENFDNCAEMTSSVFSKFFDLLLGI
jgi:hypothetical protein